MLALAVALLATGCGGGKGLGTPFGKRATAPAVASTEPVAAPTVDAAGCRIVRAPKPRRAGHLGKPTLRLGAHRKRRQVALDTNCGRIVIALAIRRAPRTASSFASLVRKRFYDRLTFHRIVADFVVQGGDPLGVGRGGPGYRVVERPPRSVRYTRGLVAMAKAAVDPAGTSGSQFFIVTARNAGLPPDYALIGRVTRGMGTVEKIAAEPVNRQGRPLNAVVIEKATLRSIGD